MLQVSGENAGNPAGAAGNLPGSQARSGPAAMEEREDGSWHVTGVAEMDIEVDRGSVRVISSAQAEDISVRIKDETGRVRCYLDDDKLKIARRVQEQPQGGQDRGDRAGKLLL